MHVFSNYIEFHCNSLLDIIKPKGQFPVIFLLKMCKLGTIHFKHLDGFRKSIGKSDSFNSDV